MSLSERSLTLAGDILWLTTTGSTNTTNNNPSHSVHLLWSFTCVWVLRLAWWRGWKSPWCGHGAAGWLHGGTGWVMWVVQSRPEGHDPLVVPHETCCGLLSPVSGGIGLKRMRKKLLQLQRCWAWREKLQAYDGPKSCRKQFHLYFTHTSQFYQKLWNIFSKVPPNQHKVFGL